MGGKEIEAGLTFFADDIFSKRVVLSHSADEAACIIIDEKSALDAFSRMVVGDRMLTRWTS